MRSRISLARPTLGSIALSAAAALTLTAWAPPALSQQGAGKQAGDQGGSFSVQPEKITFGKTALFFQRTDSFVVRNHGNSALRNLKVDLAGGNANVFSLDNGCGESLAPGQQCEVKVHFKPTSDGEKSAEVRVTAGNEAVRTRPVAGAGVAAKYTATPRSLAFGKVANGTSSAEQVVTITNTGDVPLPITATSLGGQNEKQFAQSNDCPRELAVGKSCRSTVKFRPTWNGEHQATLTVWAKGGASETQVALSGTGTGGRDGEPQKTSSR